MKDLKNRTTAKLAEFGQPKPARIGAVEGLIKNYETMKSYKITGKHSDIWKVIKSQENITIYEKL